jgi:hypothetical protein
VSAPAGGESAVHVGEEQAGLPADGAPARFPAGAAVPGPGPAGLPAAPLVLFGTGDAPACTAGGTCS